MADQQLQPPVRSGTQVSGAIAVNYAGYVREITLGLQTVIELAEQCANARQENAAPPLSDHQLSTLLRLADRAAESLDEETAQFESYVKPTGALRG